MDDRIVKIVLLLAATILFAFTVFVNYLSLTEAGRNIGWFENKNTSDLAWNQRGNVRDTGVTPPGFAFLIWGVIYAYQGVSLAYQWSQMFRRDAEGTWLCSVPGLMPIGTLIGNSVTSIGNIAWTFLADRVDSINEMLVPQTIAIFAVAGGMVLALACHCQLMYSQQQQLWSAGDLKREFWLTVCLHVNANAFYVGWVTVASFLNLDIAIINLSMWSVQASDSLCVANLMVLLGAYALMDLTILYTRVYFVFGQYATIVWALATSLSGTYNGKTAATVLTIQMLVIVFGVLLLKILMLALCRHRGIQWSGGAVQDTPRHEQAHERQDELQEKWQEKPKEKPEDV